MVMIKLKNIVLAFAVLAAVVSCGKKGEKSLDITGEWNLTRVETKATTIGDQSVDVYVSFASDNTFEIYQMLGTGRYRKFSGTWTLTEKTLDGKYSDGTLWGSSYEVEIAEDVMTLSSASGEVSTYKKSSIPDSVKSNAI
jgi:hypothetical protein